MITVKLMGGLGNQMFQAAYALSLMHRGYHVQLDKSSLTKKDREYALGYFGIEANGTEGALDTRHTEESLHLYERCMTYDSANHAPPDPCTMVGYWQTEKYFTNISERVRTAFQFKDQGPDSDIIAIHVRRGDYVELQHFHGMPDINYYREGVRYIRRMAGRDLPVRIFSDDHRWCSENFPPEFTIINGGNKYEDLKLMASCDYHVISNSSYSWWGTWLSRDRLTVAPKKWFTADIQEEIAPDRWIKL